MHIGVRVSDPLEHGVTDSCDLARGCWESNLAPVEESLYSYQLNYLSSPNMLSSLSVSCLSLPWVLFA